MTKFSLEQGRKLIKLARKSIEYYFAAGNLFREEAPKEFSEKQGVFVTLKKFPKNELRGCIGFPYPQIKLWNAIIEAGASAAFKDPRFNAMEFEELEKITVEISVLSVPEEITGKKEKVQEKIKIGKDGLIVKKNGYSGLLLPRVPLEWKWGKKEFLEQTCEKAGLDKDTWKEKDCKILKFQAQVFQEKTPKGIVAEEKSE